MKRYVLILAMVTCAAVLLAACSSPTTAPTATVESEGEVVPVSSSEAPETSSVSESAPVDEGEVIPMGNAVYRGQATLLQGEEGSFEVTQLPGFDYGQTSIIFHMGPDTAADAEGLELADGAFVEVEYNGVLTRSMPPQTTALRIEVISPRSEGIVVNGSIVSAEKGDNGYTVTIQSFDGVDGRDGQIVLNVPEDVLEELTEADLVEGTEVSAVTRGIATASIPPQMPVVALLPYSAGADAPSSTV